ncbi:hypothetical protein A9X77_06095 [Brachyspira hyodysenteriae]|nr:hypothetical protein A9X77_06095 [Brachyspira hyodysenteriae]
MGYKVNFKKIFYGKGCIFSRIPDGTSFGRLHFTSLNIKIYGAECPYGEYFKWLACWGGKVDFFS